VSGRFIVILLVLAQTIFAQNQEAAQTHTIQGRVSFEKNIAVTVTCLTREEFEEELPAQYFFVQELKEQDRRNGFIDYEISGIPAGKYMLFAFQDKNENDRLDRFLFIPKEPWDIYGLPRPAEGKPDFEKLAIDIETSRTEMNFMLKKGF
jgi:uncharacterized protein (DUF2141 family)